MILRLTLALTLAACINAQPLRSLKTLPVPATPGLENYVRNQDALIALGKAFFWDMQAGSDGRTACATCHFHAGADHRAQNTISDPNNPFPANAKLTADMFPLRTPMRIGSAGTFRRLFQSILPEQPGEAGEEALDHPEFMIGDLQVRRVTARNSPSVINAAYYQRSFWDGRAARVFNGFTPSGLAQDAPGALVTRNGQLVREAVSLNNASLASQATGPILDHLEMSYAGRTWPQLGRKLFSLRPLGLQRVAADDSVLGRFAGERGLVTTYPELVRAAFLPELWDSTDIVDGQYTQMESNFPLFWALALQAYQSTLLSNDTPLDRFLDGNTAALNAQEREGMQLFQTTGRCTTCHGGAELSAAGFTVNGGRGGGGFRAFQRTGVRPATDDAGSGAGSFKSIGLRNIELTGPYFHNGGYATLEQLVDFYARGGDFANGAIRPFTVTASQKAALVAFLRALTDDRVRFERAPFDHPELCVPSGSQPLPQPGAFLRASQENWVGLAPVGAAGNSAPIQTFEELLAGIGSDGSRTNAMTAACAAPLQ